MDDPGFVGLKMVVIDDDKSVLKAICELLEDFGCEVQGFSDPRRGIEWIRKNSTDILLTDIAMPECDGFEVMEQVKGIRPECEVILLTAHGEIDTAIKALRRGAADFFEKPFDSLELRAAIERTTRFRLVSRQKDLLSARVFGLSTELDQARQDRAVMLGQSDAMKEVARSTIDVAASSATVLIVGESGTGKELVANAIHRASPRAEMPLLTVNCASIPETLFESQMFGHMKGSFTGASQNHSGYVTAAEGGTLFLDEIGDLSLPLQAKILRLLEEKLYLPVGGNREMPANIRLIAATNQPLDELVAKKLFRQDLYYRLTVFTIDLPPLRDRKGDIELLATHFAVRFSSEVGRAIDGIATEALEALQSYDFPGNVRELRNIIENAVIHVRHDGKLTVEDLPARLAGSDRPVITSDAEWPMSTMRLEEVERRLYKAALRKHGQNVSAAAREVGLSRSKLRRRLEALGL